MKLTNTYINLVVVMLAAVAICFGGFAWAEAPPPSQTTTTTTPQRRPVQLFAAGEDGELVPVVVPSPSPAHAPSASPISGEAAFWSGVTAVALVFANGIVGVWMKLVDRNPRIAQLEIRLLREAAVARDANDEKVRIALDKVDRAVVAGRTIAAETVPRETLDAQGAAVIRDLQLGRLAPRGQAARPAGPGDRDDRLGPLDAGRGEAVPSFA